MKKIVSLIILLVLSSPAQADYLSRAMADIGRNPTGLSHQWCGTMMHRWTGIGGNTAASFMRVGHAVSPRRGAIVVSRGGHHVSIIIRCEGRMCLLVAGNHTGYPGHRVVGTGWYSISSFNSVRMP